jgi:Tfp pilus assembly protein FimT
LLYYSSIGISNLLLRQRLAATAESVGQLFTNARFMAIKNNRPVIVSIMEAGDPDLSRISAHLDRNRDNIARGDRLLQEMNVGLDFKTMFISMVRDCTKVVGTIIFAPSGIVKSVDGGSGDMPIIITVDSQMTTDPDSLKVIINRSGIWTIEEERENDLKYCS